MNRLSALSLKIAAAALALAVLAAVPAEARIKKPAHKKKEDLSANPLAASTPTAGQGALRQGHGGHEEEPLRRVPA